MHVSPYLSRRSILAFPESFSNIGQFLPQKCQDHKKGGYFFAWRQLHERSTIILYFRHNLHASYLLVDYHHCYQWYVYIVLLEVFALFSLEISYFLGPFGMTLFACTFYLSF